MLVTRLDASVVKSRMRPWGEIIRVIFTPFRWMTSRWPCRFTIPTSRTLFDSQLPNSYTVPSRSVRSQD